MKNEDEDSSDDDTENNIRGSRMVGLTAITREIEKCVMTEMTAAVDHHLSLILNSKSIMVHLLLLWIVFYFEQVFKTDFCNVLCQHPGTLKLRKDFQSSLWEAE